MTEKIAVLDDDDDDDDDRSRVEIDTRAPAPARPGFPLDPPSNMMRIFTSSRNCCCCFCCCGGWFVVAEASAPPAAFRDSTAVRLSSVTLAVAVALRFLSFSGLRRDGS